MIVVPSFAVKHLFLVMLAFFVGVGVLALGLVLFFLPSVVAFSKHVENRLAILLLNLFFGWTVVGWLVLLIWALVARPRASR